MSKRIACFDDWAIVREFQPYSEESEAIKEANEWFKTRTIHVPQVVFPFIRSMKVYA